MSMLFLLQPKTIETLAGFHTAWKQTLYLPLFAVHSTISKILQRMLYKQLM